jgi:hypothetical protein
MNRRLIEKILTAKHKQFVESITDPKVREMVDKNSIITGGSIVSLLLREPVNDYDYYFTNAETTRAVAEYFVHKFNAAHPDAAVHPKVVFKDDRVQIWIQSAGICSENSDVEYHYFEQRPEEAGMNYVDHITAPLDAPEDPEKPPFRPIFMSSNAITLSGKIQLVMRFYGSPEKIHENYDFIHCCNYWTSFDHKLTLNPAALESIIAKQLYYQGSLYPICSVIRLRKFINKGWYINAGQILKILFQISQLDLTNIDILRDQLTGVDSAYFMQLIDYCKKRQEEDPKFKLTVPYLVAVIDKIFG